MAEPVGIVLGSGLGPLADRVAVTKTVGFAEAGLPVSSVKGHAGRFLFGSLGGRVVGPSPGRRMSQRYALDNLPTALVVNEILGKPLALRQLDDRCV